MTDNTNTNIIDKIKKLIALSEDSGATEAEKLLALQKAQRLMLQYSLSEEALLNGSEPEIVESEFKLDRPIFYLDAKKLCMIAGLVGESFGCYACFNRKGQVKLFGFRVNCQIVDYTIKVLLNQGIRDCATGWKLNPSASYKMSFWKGFTVGLEERFTKIKLSDEVGIQLYDKVKDFFIQRVKFTDTVSFFGADSEAHSSGKKSARDAVVTQALNTQSGVDRKLL